MGQIALKFNEETSVRGRVYWRHFEPSKLTADDLSDAILVSDLPTSIPQAGKSEVLYINPQTNELWYEYVTEVGQEKTEIENLKTQQSLMQSVLDDLILNGGVI